MNPAIVMVITSAAILGVSFYVAYAGLEVEEWESNIDFKKLFMKRESQKKSKKGRKKKKSR